METGKIKIPVYGSGDLFSAYDCQSYLQYTKASGVIIARGAIHNLDIFKYKNEILEKEK